MRQHRFAALASACAAAMLAGCAAPDMDAALQQANAEVTAVAPAPATLARDEEQRRAAERLAADLLADPLTMEAAVRLALAHSPAFQATLAEAWGELAAARQRGLPGGVVFSFEHLRAGGDLEIGRLLSVGLFDLLTLPQRQAVYQLESERARVRLASAIVEQVAEVRQAWVRAVAAREMERYALQVREAADASAELAARMQRAGNFSKLQAARQHLFYADATARLATARQLAVSAREALVRQLGLDPQQAATLRLPERLPDLPKVPRDAAEVGQALVAQRLDARMARLALEAAGRSRGVDWAASLLDVEAGVRRDTLFGAAGQKSEVRGWELDIRLPLFDWGATQAAALDARSLAAAQRYQAVARAATSQVREGYAAYRSAHDLARHQRDELLPLRKTISEENLLRYNAMLIGVFELLADARDQVGGVMAAIEAQREFWLADAALSSILIGKPLAITPAAAPGTAAAAAADH